MQQGYMKPALTPKLKIHRMKKSLIIFLLLLFSGGLKIMAQLPWSDASIPISPFVVFLIPILIPKIEF